MIVRFASVSDVREFVGLATLQPYAIDVVDGEHVVSAKNFMELFTINFTHPLQVQIADSPPPRHRQCRSPAGFSDTEAVLPNTR